MPKESTSKEIASLAGRGLALDNLTKAERMKVYASALTQHEPIVKRVLKAIGLGGK